MAEESKDSVKISKTTLKLVAFVLVAFVVGFALGRYAFPTGTTTQPTGTTGDGTQPTPTVDMKKLVDDDPAKGPANAKVTIVEFSDYQCPYCGRVEPTVKQILSTYGDKVRFVYRDFPLSSLHQNAQKASEASECADKQGKFWEYHDKLYQNQSALDVTSLKKYAADLKLDTTKFNQCLDSGEMTAEVQKDEQDGVTAGVDGTPSFFINGESIVGAQPFEAFKAIIDAKLAG